MISPGSYCYVSFVPYDYIKAFKKLALVLQ
jgi:hypothetical protein